MNPKQVVEKFNKCINDADINELKKMLTEDHIFVDSAGESIVGKSSVENAWEEFFEKNKDYKNIFEEVTVDGEVVMAIGKSESSNSELSGAARWIAKVRDEKISYWKVIDMNSKEDDKD